MLVVLSFSFWKRPGRGSAKEEGCKWSTSPRFETWTWHGGFERAVLAAIKLGWCKRSFPPTNDNSGNGKVPDLLGSPLQIFLKKYHRLSSHFPFADSNNWAAFENLTKKPFDRDCRLMHLKLSWERRISPIERIEIHHPVEIHPTFPPNFWVPDFRVRQGRVKVEFRGIIMWRTVWMASIWCVATLDERENNSVAGDIKPQQTISLNFPLYIRFRWSNAFFLLEFGMGETSVAL